MLLATALSMPAPAQDEWRQQGKLLDDRFQLLNACKPIGLIVGSVSDDVQALGIAEKDVQAAAESRLRAARLYAPFGPQPWAFLYVVASRHTIQLQYRKPVCDPASGQTRPMPTFSKAAKVSDGTAAGVMLALSKLLDLFLIEYLRVNESACEQAHSPGRAPGAEAEAKPHTENNAEIYRFGNGVIPPRLLYKVEPEYSKKAWKAKLQGTVLLGIEVWEDGLAHNIRVLRSLGLGLDEKAIEAVKQWKFAPGRTGCCVPVKVVKVAAQIQVSFKRSRNEPRGR